MRILGIDPGSARLGYGVVDCEGSRLIFIDAGVIEIHETNREEKMLSLTRRLREIIAQYNPDISGVEKLFFAKNRKTATSVSEARGMILLTLAEKQIRILECAPRAVKYAVTGYGLADKKAVANMVVKLLNIEKRSFALDDASDALAIAITVAQEERLNEAVKKRGVDTRF